MIDLFIALYVCICFISLIYIWFIVKSFDEHKSIVGIYSHLSIVIALTIIVLILIYPVVKEILSDNQRHHGSRHIMNIIITIPLTFFGFTSSIAGIIVIRIKRKHKGRLKPIYITYYFLFVLNFIMFLTVIKPIKFFKMIFNEIYRNWF